MSGFLWLPTLSAIESFLRIFVDLAVIAAGFRAFQALGIYIGKNSK